jgi:hypothetical protein
MIWFEMAGSVSRRTGSTVLRIAAASERRRGTQGILYERSQPKDLPSSAAAVILLGSSAVLRHQRLVVTTITGHMVKAERIAPQLAGPGCPCERQLFPILRSGQIGRALTD